MVGSSWPLTTLMRPSSESRRAERMWCRSPPSSRMGCVTAPSEIPPETWCGFKSCAERGDTHVYEERRRGSPHQTRRSTRTVPGAWSAPARTRTGERTIAGADRSLGTPVLCEGWQRHLLHQNGQELHCVRLRRSVEPGARGGCPHAPGCVEHHFAGRRNGGEDRCAHK